MTIEQLAAAAGMTVRNVREHQTRGLLPPPELEGRKGFYGERHLARLRTVRELQEQGLNLQAVAWLLDRAPAEAVSEVARLQRALFAPWLTDEPRTYTLADLTERFGAAAGDQIRERVVALGLLRPVGEDQWQCPAPRLLEAGAQLVELGVDLEAVIDVLEQLLANLGAVAATFIDLFLGHILPPREPGADVGDRAERVGEALERLRPIASEAVLSSFQLRMDELARASRSASLS